MKYKTKGNSSPYGKPRVYFCCHPEDFSRFFESVSDEILAEQNCAVWYTDAADVARDEDFLSDLAQMQLFVMPVTSKLLYTKNPVIDREFPFALAHHIPVLPLMQEDGLEAVFNQTCGDIQFLDKSVKDITAIPYGEKLRSYLSSVLVGDELAKKIRSAFDAYIFLSYRKKDRKHAQELMRLIHKNEFCRDIAIWYDEFLTPGENFNDAIKEALNKSGLFVMTVTPNLVQDQNYVMTTEYPMAKQAEKRILPVEMVETDKRQLFEKYDRLPPLTDAHDEAALSATLLSELRALAIEESNDSPEHNFFIGLAYLGGIDVEVDHTRAVSLITSSAEAGLREAIDKLIHMYRNGEGVARSYASAVEWCEKKILSSEREYRCLGDAASLHTLFWDIIDCGDAYDQLGKATLAREKYEDANRRIEASELRDSDRKLLRDQAVACDRLARSCTAVRDYKGSKSYCEKNLSICERLFAEEPDVVARQDLIIAYKNMGIPGNSGANAVRYREKAISMAEELVAEDPSIYSRRILFNVYSYHGLLLKVSGKDHLPEAREYYEKALSVAEAMYAETDSAQTSRDLATMYGLMSGISGSVGDPEAEAGYRIQETALLEKLVDKTDAVEDRSRLSGAYARIAMAHHTAGDEEQAVAYCERTITMRERLVEETDRYNDRENLRRDYAQIGDIYKGLGDIKAACRYYKKICELCERVAQTTEEPYRYDHLAEAYDRMAGISTEETREYQRKAWEIFERLYREKPQNPYYQARYQFYCSQLNF